MNTPLLPNHEPFNCFTNSMQHSTHIAHQQQKPTESASRVSKLTQSEVDKDILLKLKIQLPQDTKMLQKGEVMQQCEEPLAQILHMAPKARENDEFIENLRASSQIRKVIKNKQLGPQDSIKSNQKQVPHSHNTEEMGIDKAEDENGIVIEKKDESKTNKAWSVPAEVSLRLSVTHSKMPKDSKSTTYEKNNQDSAERKSAKSQSKFPASQNIASGQEQEIQPKHEDRDIMSEVPCKPQIDKDNCIDKTYPDIAETEDRKCKTVDTSSISQQSTLKSKGVMHSENPIPENSDHEGWIKCHGRRLCGKKPWYNMKNKGSWLTTQYKGTNVMKALEGSQPGSNRPVDALLPHHNHPDDYRIPINIRENTLADKLSEESKSGNTMDKDLTTSDPIVDLNNSKPDQNLNLITTLNSRPISQKNHQLESRPEEDKSLDMVGSEPQSPGFKESSQTREETDFTNISDDDILTPVTPNVNIVSPNRKTENDQNFVESGTVEEYGSVYSLHKGGGSSVNKENAKNKESRKKQKKDRNLNKSKVSKVSEKPLPQSISQIMKTHVGKAILETLQFPKKKRLLPINLDKQSTLILADDCLHYKMTGEHVQEKRLAWVKTFHEFTLQFGDECEAQRRVSALLAQFSQNTNQIYFKEMKDFLSKTLLKVLEILKVEEEFPLFQDFDSAKYSNFQKLKSELSEVDSLKLLYVCSKEELNTCIHQMSIMSRIDHSSILFKSHEMKDFLKQGGSLQSVLEIQHNLGFGMEEKIWKKMEEYKTKERALNIIYAMLGTSISQDVPELLWSVSQQWFGTYTRDFFFKQPQLSHIFEERFGILVEYSEKLPPTKLSNWMTQKEASEVGTISQSQLQWGKVMVGVHCGIPLIYLWHGLVLIYDKVELKYRPGIKDKKPLYWPLNLPANMDYQFARFKKFFEFFGKRLLLTNKF
ncbi:uncharacterized protein MELLADRAFT_66058 [Melampsora larici-populina 98AG31]|uniref:Uncharacterized protein n=1 Tax=Melampsora larici-populina (strain 98AG31 / pathotype 3-4-7) TaxID=747676 RepID=F4RXQ6_MELLP|nr:uncharacterized protein MELLADRAFT_66058 [Melampsora larici-populina 98AG31]EGG02770.1 hypothetical protein MELLADRAFT_66058 [Melampsora larici-populina 98AG31]